MVALAGALVATHAVAQWSAGSSPVIGAGETVTITSPQPNIVSLTDNGTLAFEAGGSVTITGALVTAVGSGTGGTGVLNLNGGAVTHSGSGTFVVGYLGATGHLNIASGAVLSVPSSRVRLAGNEEGFRVLPAYGDAVVSGTFLANVLEFTGFFPTNLAPPYVESATLTLNAGGTVEVGSIVKNDAAASTFLFNGGTLRFAQTTSDAITGRGVLSLMIADGAQAIIDTNGRNVTINPQGSPYESVLTFSGETNALAAGDGGLMKTGLGSLALRLSSACNTFTGAIEVVQGTLDLGRPLAANQTVTVHPGATFVMYDIADTNKVTVLDAPASRMLYAVGADADSLDLTAIADTFYDDRLGSPVSGAVTLSGTLAHSASVGSVGSPFRLVGLGGTLNLTNTMLESEAVQVEGTGTFNFMGNRSFASADAGKIAIADGGYRQDQTFAVADANSSTPAALGFSTGRFMAGNSLDIGISGYGSFSADGVTLTAGKLQVGGGTGFAGAFSQSTGAVTLGADSYVGMDGGSGSLIVTGGQFIANSSLRVACNPSANTSLRPQGSVTVSNALLRCSEFRLTSWWPTDGSAKTVEAGLLTLQSGGVLETGDIYKNDDPISTVLFDGGLLRARWSTGNFFYSGQTYGRLAVTAPAGKYIALDTGAYGVTVYKQSSTLAFTGAGGLKKLGAGTLIFSANQVDYAGDTVIEAGTLKLGDHNQIPGGVGSGDVRIETNAVWDLNGKSESVNRLIGWGSVISTNAAATLGVLADGASDTWDRDYFTGSIVLDKQGGGTLTVAAGGVLSTSVVVSAGTLRLVASQGYPYYRFKIEGLKNSPSTANSMQFSEIALYDGETNVVPFRTGIATDPVGAAFPAAETPDKVVNGIVYVGTQTKDKWLDFRAASTDATLRDRVWIRIDFPVAQKITSYNWATANDAQERDPASWRLQGSFNGTTWVDVDVRTNYTATSTRNAWVEPATGFAVSSSSAAPDAIADSAVVTVKTGATLALEGAVETLGGLEGGGVVALSGSELGVSNVTGTSASFYGTITGSGSVVKVGEGTQNLWGTNTFSGGLTVWGGALNALGGTADRWFRFTMQENLGDTNVTQLSEFALYSVDGTRQNLGLVLGSSVGALQPGQFATPATYSLGSSSESADKLFDGLTTTKWCLNNNTPLLGTPSTYRVVVMRLTNGAPEIIGYSICTANDVPARDPVTWLLESSPDGAVWKTVAAQTNAVPPTARYTWYNNGTAFGVSSRAVEDSDGDVIPDAALVEVRSGATLSVADGNETIGALFADMVAGAGTITRLTAAANGALYLVNVSGSPTTWSIPLTILDVTNPGALKTWIVYADGVPVNGYTLTWNPQAGTFQMLAAGTRLLLQ